MLLRSPVVVAALLLAVVTVGVGGCARRAQPVPVAPVALSGPAPLEILRAWESRRAGAWAAGDGDALRALYLPGSAAGAEDVRRLHAYAARGLRVTGITMQVLRARTLVRRPDQVRVEVVERFAAGTVTGRGAVRPLPVGQASRRVVELRRRNGVWVLGTIRALPSAQRGP